MRVPRMRTVMQVDIKDDDAVDIVLQVGMCRTYRHIVDEAKAGRRILSTVSNYR